MRSTLRGIWLLVPDPFFKADYCGWPFHVNREAVLLAESRSILRLFINLSPI